MAKDESILDSHETIEEIVTKPADVINNLADSKHAKTIGAWLFIIGFVLAVLTGLINGAAAAGLVNMGVNANDAALLGFMALIGLIVGIVNVNDKEAINFLIGAIAITVAAGAMAPLAGLGVGMTGAAQMTSSAAVFVGSMMQMIGAFIAPAAIIVGLKVVYSAARKA